MRSACAGRSVGVTAVSVLVEGDVLVVLPDVLPWFCMVWSDDVLGDVLLGEVVLVSWA